MTTREKLLRIADVLRAAPRLGDASDDPEGSRYILITDTAADLIADFAEEIADDTHVAPVPA